MSWAAMGVILSGAATCLLTGFVFAAAARPNPAAAVLYTATCAGVLGLLLAVEALTIAFRGEWAQETAERQRTASLRTLMRAAPHSQARF
jgi:hypothetical protein